MFLHIRLRIRHWSNLSEFSFCVWLLALNHSEKILGFRKNAIKSKKPGLSFASGPAGIEACSFVSDLLEKAYSTKQRYHCNSLSCKLLPQLIDNSATKGFLLTDNALLTTPRRKTPRRKLPDKTGGRMTNPGYEKSTIRNFRDAKIPHCDNAQHNKSLMRLIDEAWFTI